MNRRATPDDLRNMLRSVMDPELGSDIVDLGMVGEIRIDDDGEALVEVILTTSGCPLRAQIQRDVRERLAHAPGIAKVRIKWGEMDQDQKAATMARARLLVSERPEDTSIAMRTQVILVASGKGGVGKSSVTANLAAALAARGAKVGVLDADVWGFSIPRMLGVSGRLGAEEVDGKKKISPFRRPMGDGELRIVSMGLLVDDEETALMWRGLMLNRGVQHFLQDVEWGDDLDYLLVDMPPGTGDVQMGVAKTVPRSQVLVVTTPALAAQKVAIRAVSMARKSYLRVVGVIENMSEFHCEHGGTYALFGSGGGRTLADDAGIPLLGQVPLEPTVSAGGDIGEPVVLGEGPAAEEFRRIAAVLNEELIPIQENQEMVGCSARVFAAGQGSGAGGEVPEGDSVTTVSIGGR